MEGTRYECIECSSHNWLTDEQMAAKAPCSICGSDLGFATVVLVA